MPFPGFPTQLIIPPVPFSPQPMPSRGGPSTAIPLQILMAMAAQQKSGAPMARSVGPASTGLPFAPAALSPPPPGPIGVPAAMRMAAPPAAPLGAIPAVSEIGKPSLAEQLQLLQLLMKLGLWPQQDIPEHGGFGLNLPAPDMPDLGFPWPDPNETYPGQEFEGFYGPGGAEAPQPFNPLGRGPRRVPSVPYPIGPLPEGRT